MLPVSSKQDIEWNNAFTIGLQSKHCGCIKSPDQQLYRKKKFLKVCKKLIVKPWDTDTLKTNSSQNKHANKLSFVQLPLKSQNFSLKFSHHSQKVEQKIIPMAKHNSNGLCVRFVLMNINQWLSCFFFLTIKKIKLPLAHAHSIMD